MNTNTLLEAQPKDLSQDFGPTHRGDMPVAFWTIVSILIAISGYMLAMRYGHTALAIILAIVFGLLGLWGIWCIAESLIHDVSKDKAPFSHSLLAGELGFDLPFTCGNVAMTAFFMPDKISPGGRTTLMLFMENYSSRQRAVHVRVGRLPSLNRMEREMLHLKLAAGQAAVYVLPMRAAMDITPGDHRLTLTILVNTVTGEGQRLSRARTRFLNIKKCRLATPIEVLEKPADMDTTPLPAPRYLTLASINEKAPNIEVLEEIIKEIDASPAV